MMVQFRSKGHGRNRKVYPVRRMSQEKYLVYRPGYRMHESLKDKLENDVEYVLVTRDEGTLATDDLHTHRFKTLREADHFIREQSITAPPEGHGYHKTDVIIHFRNGYIYRFRYDMNRDVHPNLEESVLSEQKFLKEHKDVMHDLANDEKLLFLGLEK